MRKVARLVELSFEFEEEDLECENLPAISPEDAKAVLFKTQNVFSQIGVDVYLTYGTLLGAVRDQAIIPGDLDGSGEVDIFDIVTIMDWILDPDSVEGFVEKAADFNGDGDVDVFDVVDMMDWILTHDDE